MSLFGAVKPCKHGLTRQDCHICRVQAKTLSKEAVTEVKQILTGNLPRNRAQRTFRTMNRKV